MKLEIRPAPHCCETRETLAAIAQLLDRKEWDSDTLNAVADVVRSAGFQIRDPEECDQ